MQNKRKNWTFGKMLFMLHGVWLLRISFLLKIGSDTYIGKFFQTFSLSRRQIFCGVMWLEKNAQIQRWEIAEIKINFPRQVRLDVIAVLLDMCSTIFPLVHHALTSQSLRNHHQKTFLRFYVGKTRRKSPVDIPTGEEFSLCIQYFSRSENR